MGQEISQQKKCSNISRQKTHQQTPQSLQPHPQRDATKNLKPSKTNFTTSNGKYTRHSQEFQGVYAPSSNISTTSSSSTDDEHYRLRQKYNLNKQTYEKFRASKKLSLISSTTDQSTSTSTSNSASTNSSSSAYQNPKSSEPTYKNIVHKPSQQKRKNSSSTDSGIYYASCHCTPSFLSSSATSSSSLCSTSACGCSTSGTSSSNQSRSSLVQKKNYLFRHLHIKSYLDILEEDEKARAHFKSAKPGGIRNYKPKILGEVALSTSAPQSTGFSISSNNLKLREKCKEDPWI